MSDYRNLEMQKKTNSRKEDYKYFVGSTLKNPLEYKIGEKMMFKIRVKYLDDYLDIPYISYSLSSDDGQEREGYIEKSEDGWFYIEASVSKSGFVYIQAKACDENKNIIEDIAVFNGSAGADIYNINRATITPDDYHEFWNGLKSQVEAIVPELLYSEKIEKNPDFEMFDMRIKSPGNEYASVSVAYPKNAQKGSLKFAMYFQGYSVASTSPNPLKDYFTVYVNAHSMPNHQSEEFYTDLKATKLTRYGFDEEENKKPETTYWAKMFLRDLTALKYFKDHELLNKKDYYFVGSSQGGMQACNMGAQFEKTSAVILNVPWLSDIDAHKLAGRKKTGMPSGDGIAYFDTAVAAQFLKCPAYIISGLGDVTCNAGTQMSLYNAIKTDKYHEFYQNKVHSFTIPWDNMKYTLGNPELDEKYIELTSMYKDWN